MILSNNQLQALPESLTKLDHLELLVLSKNQIEKMPHQLGQLKELRTLILSGNPLTEQEKKRIQKALPKCDIRF